jgi:hypothetical protein
VAPVKAVDKDWTYCMLYHFVLCSTDCKKVEDLWEHQGAVYVATQRDSTGISQPRSNALEK